MARKGVVVLVMVSEALGVGVATAAAVMAAAVMAAAVALV
jgi:hypothetical protein